MFTEHMRWGFIYERETGSCRGVVTGHRNLTSCFATTGRGSTDLAENKSQLYSMRKVTELFMISLLMIFVSKQHRIHGIHDSAHLSRLTLIYKVLTMLLMQQVRSNKKMWSVHLYTDVMRVCTCARFVFAFIDLLCYSGLIRVCQMYINVNSNSKIRSN